MEEETPVAKLCPQAHPKGTSHFVVADTPVKFEQKTARLQPPRISRSLQLKWGLALLGEEKAEQYLTWLRFAEQDRRGQTAETTTRQLTQSGQTQ